MVREASGWVWPENVRTVMEYLSRWVGYDFDDLDWQAIEHALPTTSWEPPERWFSYPVAGTPALTVRFARDPDAAPVAVRVQGDLDDVLEARVDTLLALLAELRAGS